MSEIGNTKAGALSVSLRRIEWLHPQLGVARPGRVGGLSVSLRRIEWLHLAREAVGLALAAAFSIPSSDRMAASLPAGCLGGNPRAPFQYPFVGSNGCIRSPRARAPARSPRAPFSIPSSDRMAASGARPDRAAVTDHHLSVSLRRIEWLHQRLVRESGVPFLVLSVSLRRIEWLHPPAGTLPATPSRTLCRSTAPFSCHSQHRLRPLSCSPPAFRRKSQFCASGHPFCEPSCHFPRLGNTWTARPGSPTAPFRPHSAPGSRPGLRH